MFQAARSADYDRWWSRWGDMIKYSPAPFHRRRLILQLMAELSFDSVLDVGCGNGETLRAIAERFPNARLSGVDLSPSVVQQNQAAWPEVDFAPLDLGEAALPRSFDLVVCTEVVEHVQDADRALQHLRRMCERHLILTVPAGPVFPIDRGVGHVRHFQRDELCARLARAGFRVERAWRWGFPFHTLYKSAINLFPEATMDGFAGKEYGLPQRLVSEAVRALFYLNLRDAPLARQLVVLAHAT